MRGRGGFIGFNRTATTTAASGVWTLREANSLKRAGTWPTSPPGGVGSGLQLWLDAAAPETLFGSTTGGSLVAADGAVARWEDKSGNSRHLTQSETIRRPVRRAAIIAGQDAVDFDGINDALALNQSLFSSRTSLAWFVVVKNDDAGDNTRAAFGERVAFNDANFSLQKVGTNSIAYSRGAENGATSVRITESVTFPTSAMLACVVTTASAGTARRNGQIAGTSATTTNNVEYKQLFLIGNVPADDADYSVLWWDGLICEVIVYNSALSDTDRAAVESYLMQKWSIA
jgi:hypothetical protein